MLAELRDPACIIKSPQVSKFVMMFPPVYQLDSDLDHYFLFPLSFCETLFPAIPSVNDRTFTFPSICFQQYSSLKPIPHPKDIMSSSKSISMAAKVGSQPTCHLMRLPTEIREMIYRPLVIARFVMVEHRMNSKEVGVLFHDFSVYADIATP